MIKTQYVYLRAVGSAVFAQIKESANGEHGILEWRAKMAKRPFQLHVFGGYTYRYLSREARDKAAANWSRVGDRVEVRDGNEEWRKWEGK